MAWLSGWNYRQKLTIDHTLIDADCTNFPVKVIVPPSNELFNKAKVDGSDVRFTASDGTTLLDFEQEVYVKSDIENVLFFDGVNDYVKATIPEINQNGLTFELRMKTNGKNSYAGIVGHDGSRAYDHWLFRETSSGYQFTVNFSQGGIVSIPASLLNDGKLHHVAGTYDGSTAKLYVDGVLQAEENFSVTFSSSSLVIGRYEGGASDFYYFNGEIYEVRVWNVARSQAEIQDNMNTILSGTETGLVVYYKFDEGTGTTLTDYAGDNDGTIYGATWKTSGGNVAVYHVKVPLVSSTSDTDFYMYYDNSNATDASNPSAVWDNNYAMVHHMTPTLEDSTANNRDGTNYGSTLELANDGYRRWFDGSNDYIDTGTWSLGNVFTIEAFFQPELKNYGEIFGESFTVTMLTCADGHMFATVGNGIGWNTALNPGAGALTSFTDAYVVFRNDNKAGELFIDGVSRDTKTFTHTPPSGQPMYIAKRANGGYLLKGYIYEFRLSLFARSDAWIKATSYTLYDQLLTIGTEETQSGQPVSISAPAITFSNEIKQPAVITVRSVSINAPSVVFSNELKQPIINVAKAVSITALTITFSNELRQPVIIPAKAVSISAPAITLTQNIPIPIVSISVLLQIPSTAYTATVLSPTLKVSSTLLTTQINFQAQTQSPILKLSCQLETGPVGFSTSAPVPDISTGCQLETNQIGFNISMPVANVIVGQEVIVTAPVLNWNSCVPESILKRSINLESPSITCMFSLIKPLVSAGEECIIQALPLQFSHAQNGIVLGLSNRLTAEPMLFSCDLVAPVLKTGVTLQAELLTWLFSMPLLSEYRKVIVYDSGISKTLSLRSAIETTVSKSSKL